jgi:hypothetical protein
MPKLRHDEEEPLKDCTKLDWTKLDQRKKTRYSSHSETNMNHHASLKILQLLRCNCNVYALLKILQPSRRNCNINHLYLEKGPKGRRMDSRNTYGKDSRRNKTLHKFKQTTRHDAKLLTLWRSTIPKSNI